METVREWLNALRTGECSARDAVTTALERIRTVDPQLQAVIAIDPERALAQADTIDRQRAGGEDPGPLAGLPIGIKDVICEKDVECTCASQILKGYRPPYDATVITMLRRAGAIPVARLNMDEFAMGSSTDHSAFAITRNPWDTNRIPGGSSGGSAAAVAARMLPCALGSDTGGSIRQPAALCGVTGLKPTYGRVSRYGLVAYASSLDQIGPLALTVEDIALLLPHLAGHDPHDATSANLPVPNYPAALFQDLRGVRLGVPKEYFIAGLDPAVETAVRSALHLFARNGADCVEISLPHTEYAIATYYIIATAEASSNLARYDGIHYGWRAPESTTLDEVYSHTRRRGFGEEVIRRIILGTYVLSSGYYDAYYLKALKVRTLIRQDFTRAFDTVDAIVTPTSPTPAFALGEKLNDPLQMYLSDIFTVSVNLAGIPGLSVPCGFSPDGLPIGLQILAKPFDEMMLLRVGHAWQQLTDFHLRRPPVCATSFSRPTTHA
ncbi:MAG: Asp-tRNA(Asn)/Glu-tRNA(Gln) amidotransferase subunit GatA [bacterium]|nr:Asp-tRNA(Asn)/Glu-tRNA(Gln) amidotransferase subunit GatA [bacterium]